MKLQSRKLLAAPLMLLVDVAVAGVCLCAFAFFHHVKPMWIDRAPEEDPTEVDYTKPSINRTDGSVVSKDVDHYFTDNTPGSSGSQGGSDEPPTPSYDSSGDFGYKFGPLFSKDDTVRVSDSAYQSHDIFMTLTSYDTTLKQVTGSKKDAKPVNTHVVYHVIDVYVRNIENLYTSYVRGSTSMDNLVADTTFGRTLAAISGDLFHGYDKQKPVIVRNGKIIRTAETIASDICVLYYDGSMETITPEEYDWDAISEKSPYQIWSFGPELMNSDGSPKTMISSSVWRTNPRSAIGYVEPGHYVLVSVSGYRDSSEAAANGVGVNLDVLAQICADHGCVSAYNLDGGASVYSYYNGKKLVVVSNASGSKRSISDIICVGEIGGN